MIGTDSSIWHYPNLSLSYAFSNLTHSYHSGMFDQAEEIVHAYYPEWGVGWLQVLPNTPYERTCTLYQHALIIIILLIYR